MILVFFDAEGMIYWHHCEEKIRHQRVLPTSAEETKKAHQPEAPKTEHELVLHQDNVQLHTASLVMEWFQQNSIQLMAHPPYSPDIAPCNYWQFPVFKKALRGHHFKIDAKVIATVDAFLRSLPTEEFHKTFMQKWEN